MGISTIMAQDAISVNELHIPVTELACGYDTGSGGIQWSPEQFASRIHPYPPIHIDQDPGASDFLSDVLDVESGAANPSQVPGWYAKTLGNYLHAVRPGQRKPIVYCSMGSLDAIVQALRSAGIIDVGFWTAEPGNTLAFANQRITTAMGPYPCVGVQYSWSTFVDFDLFNLAWVSTMATKPTPPPPSANITAEVIWHGDAGITRRMGLIPRASWDTIKWTPNVPLIV